MGTDSTDLMISSASTWMQESFTLFWFEHVDGKLEMHVQAVSNEHYSWAIMLEDR
jgi:hypothetical protein